MKKISLILMLVFIVLGCSSSKPSERDIKKQMEEYMMQGAGSEIFKIKNFKKTDGLKKGDKTYIANVEYNLVFKKDVEEVAKKLKDESQNSPFGAFMNTNLALMALKMKYGDFKAGHVVSQKEEVRLISTDKGWRIDGIR